MKVLRPLNQEDFAMKIVKDLGRIYATKDSTTKSRRALFECSVCKINIEANVSSVKRSKQSKCYSCVQKTHGMRSHSLYNTWKGQRGRCNTKSNSNYHKYGGRGITFSKEFDDFKVWLTYVTSLENASKETYTIDRIDNDKGYERGNLRWASKATQSSNTRVLISTNTSGFRGVTKSLSKWRAQISVEGVHINIGTFKTKLEAATAFNKYVIDNSLHHTLNIIKD